MSSQPKSKRAAVERSSSESEAIDVDDSPTDEIWLSTAEVARRLKMRPKTLAAWAAAGRGPRYARMGRYRRYRLADLVLWELEQLAHGGGGGHVSPTYRR
ncbi:helix-turn-helix domain-containing protein [Nocardia brasiliensis]|uniref:helix-turn-helix domain-containing protein n=1 Tax=Nocardia brasiliensis TaxID=37326 RepID=UPI00366BE91C